MMSLYLILDGLQSYIDRCENCPAGRDGSCRWLKQFSVSGGDVVGEGVTHEERAKRMHKRVGFPPCNQRTFRQVHRELLRIAGKVRCEGLMPKTVTELRNFLLRVGQTAKGLEDLPDGMRAVFEDLALFALELAVGALDFYFLDTLHKDYLELFRLYLPEYDRAVALKDFTFDKAYIEECILKAEKVHIGTAMVEASVAGTVDGVNRFVHVSGTLVGLEAELVSAQAMDVWSAALSKGWVDEEYRWKLGKQEKAMFVGRFSQYLYHDKRAHWAPFKQWDSNCNYSKDFNTAKERVGYGEANEAVTAISAYFDKIDRIHSLA